MLSRLKSQRTQNLPLRRRIGAGIPLLLLLATLFSAALCCSEPARSASPTVDLDLDELWDEWLETGEYYTLVTDDEQILHQTGRKLYLDDEYLTADNQLYRVYEVDDDQHIAYAEWVREAELPDKRFSLTELTADVWSVEERVEAADGQGLIAIYHTHNAESYVPTDGTDSIDGEGGIHAVGAAFSNALERLGIDAKHAEDLHLPHDRGAYRRSRATVVDLLALEPDALYDVHRDAAPEEAYAAQIGGEEVTQVQFVVGQQNQNLGINREYAKSLKAVADETHPGLVKGILFGRGNYNQDLSPLNLLLEVGAHTNSREAAERGIVLFADVVSDYFYGPQARAAEGAAAAGAGAATRTLFWLLLFGGAAGVLFYVINAGGWKAAWERLRNRI